MFYLQLYETFKQFSVQSNVYWEADYS